MNMERREFLKTGGALIVTFTLPGSVSHALAAAAAAPGKTMVKEEIDAWLAVGNDGMITVYSGKVDLGTGTRTALAQMVAEELDVAFGKVEMVMGDTGTTIDQDQTSGSNTIQVGGAQLRQAAATARLVLLDLGSKQLGVPATGLEVADGVISVRGSGAKSVRYADLVGKQPFQTKVDAKAPLKDPKDHRIVGQSIPRVDIPAKVMATFTFAHDFRVPGMLHARVIRPADIGSKLLGYDEESVRKVPGFVKIVRKQEFLAVLARTEWGAIEAARQLKVEWSPWEGLPEQSRLYEEWRRAPVAKDEAVTKIGDVAAALATAHKTVKATYEFPMQSHASLGPACAVADFKDGKCTIWSPSQATHSLQREIAGIIDLPKESVRLYYVDGSGCYGRNGHDDCSADAALASKLAGAPVRVQWSRQDETGWDPKSPPTLVDLEGGVDAQGNVVAWRAEFWIANNIGRLDDYPLLAAMHTSVPRKSNYVGSLHKNAIIPYAFPANSTLLHRVAQAPLRPCFLRAPGRLQNTFVNEAFMDELAAAAGADPLQFRLKVLKDPRAIAVLQGAAKLAGWQSRPSPKPAADGDVAMGRGISYVRYDEDRAYVGLVADVEVNRATGVIRVKRLLFSHDCGQIINPDGLRNQIEGAAIQTIGRTLYEEVTFNRSRVTSTDWVSYPVVGFADVPEIEIDLISKPNERPWGAGETGATPLPAAISNAVFDAVGVRMRSIPFTPEKVKAALKAKSTA